MKVYIKNLICPCCRKVVKAEMERIGIPIKKIDSNEFEIEGSIREADLLLLEQTLIPLGLELIHDKKSRLIEKIKMCISYLINSSDGELKINMSEYMSSKINYNYCYLNNIFKEETGTTIEKYFISKKIEKVKELLQHDAMTLSEIAYILKYSSVAHLSNQFKKVTGLQPTFFKQIKYKSHEIFASA